MRGQRRRTAQVVRRLGVALTCAAVAAAPLAVGGVHRVSMMLLMVACALGLSFLVAASTYEGRPFRIGLGAALPLFLVVIPVLQSLPLPWSMRGLLDPNGNSLLAENASSSARLWPLSLDPPLTRQHIGAAAAALATFLVAFHLASGKTLRHVLPRVVALTGVAAVAVGLGHRIFSVTEVYGLFHTNSRSLLTGPFINGNHTAEFLELATFACLACSYQRNNALNRYGWLTGTLLCAAGAVGTLSRGSVVGMVAGTLAFIILRYLVKDGGPVLGRKVALGWGLLASALIVGTASIFGAGALVDRFRATPASQDIRFKLWRDSLRVLAAHPLGIGRGAFERVYPAYRTIKSPLPVTFAFVENHPLQLLIDSGWPLFTLVVVGLVLVVRQLIRHGRRDKIEAAFLAGLFAVGAHSTVDFGLETLGVLLPFMAILGTVLGRSRDSQIDPTNTKVVWPLVGLTCGSLLFGAVAIGHSSGADFDNLLRGAHGPDEVRGILRRAQTVHPTDYYYALAYARMEPLRSSSGKSPRLHALNRALRLCPECENVHMEVARSLWQLGSRSQSIVEWRLVAERQPVLFLQLLTELADRGAKPRELAAVATFDSQKMVEVADFLAGHSQVKEAIEVLDQADAMGAPRAESLLTRARLQLQSRQLDDLRITLAEAHGVGLPDPRLAVLDAQAIVAIKGDVAADEAMGILDLAATRYPLDLPVQRLRITMVQQYRKWQAADRAIDGLKLALFHALGTSVEANLEAARIRGQLSQWNAAFSEYRIALAQLPGQVTLWLEFGQVAERAGREATAREAYTEAARLAPSNGAALEGLHRLDVRRNELRRSGSERAVMGADWRVP